MEPEAPKIEFPCRYPIKVVGRASHDYEAVIYEVFESHAPALIEVLPSVALQKLGLSCL